MGKFCVGFLYAYVHAAHTMAPNNLGMRVCERTLASVFIFAALVEARKVQLSVEKRHWFNATASGIAGAALLTMAQEAIRGIWLPKTTG
jgi:hypothetical protein